MTLRMRIDIKRYERELAGALAVYDELPSAMRRKVLPPALLDWARACLLYTSPSPRDS